MREDQLFTRPTIALTSPNAIPKWTMALWIATILMLGIVALVSFAMPEIINRVNTQEEQP